jgi:putative ABC transport system substrate-binding protein
MQLDQLRRREFITLLGGAAAAWPVAARAQQVGKMPTIGFLGETTPSAHGQYLAVFTQRLRELGWIEGRSVAIIYRWAEGRSERVSEIAAEFIRLKVDVIVTHGAASISAMKATSVVPIVFAASGDPVGIGLVASLARPGGNLTGLSLQSPDLAGKRLELLREVVPGLRRLAILVPGPQAKVEAHEVQTSARTLFGFETSVIEVKRAEEITPAFDVFTSQAEALYVCATALATANRIRINILAVGAQLPTMHGLRELVEAGGLMSYGPSFSDLWRRAGDYVDKILRGTKPADIPVEQPTKFDLIISLITAKALRLTVPSTLLARADEVIE